MHIAERIDLMPTRAIELSMGAVTALTIGVTAASTIENLSTTVDVWGDATLLAYSLVGSMLGGLIAVLTFPPKSTDLQDAIRRISAKMIACILTGILFAPFTIRATAERVSVLKRKGAEWDIFWVIGDEVGVDILVGLSGLMAIFGVGLINLAWGRLRKIIKGGDE